ncbi:peptide synthetase [Streptomyces hygroscopicus]|uniref:Pls/PosA family non-ribosomal peptide synthetase n=1 Tax=Streptomyces hygroscopicus TaxID=1912 RepID=UPI0022404DEF|nr:Pls/PosA family non-ribosomal peptide synthetase [Streptomyces hygroscopicus]MCW7942507.1 peptide synthetase [Streptomyces hygroscopicus]
MVDESTEVLLSGPGESVVAGPGSADPTTTDTERSLADVLAEVVGVEHVSADSHFFDDLGANSLVMARFCARVRKRQDLPSVSMKDIYRHPTVRKLAAALADAAPPPVESTLPIPASAQTTSPTPVARTSTVNYVLCGTLQLLAFLAYSMVTGLVAAQGYEWVADGSGLADVYLRSLLFGGTGFVILCAFPVMAKWILIGRWKPREFPIWSLTYLRFWIVKALLHANPMILFVGNPLYVLYLRALGARIGKGVTILSRSVPVCTDLLTIGAGTVIRKDSFFLGYRAHAGRIQTGRVTLGRDVFVGEKSVLDIDTSMGDGAQLGHTSSLYRGQTIPDGVRVHGSPAEPTETDYIRVTPAPCGTWRRAGFGFLTMVQLLFVYAPLAVGGMYMLFAEVPALGDRLDPTDVDSFAEVLVDALLVSVTLLFGLAVLGLVALFPVPRLLSRAIKPDTVYPLYGFHYAAHRALVGLTNLKFLPWLFGDSSYIVPYFSRLGFDLSPVEQTGSNFGTQVKHENPYLVSVGTGTMVADALSIVNADYSSTSFRVSRASIGPRNFLGNNIAYPAGSRTGDNCLLATKVMVPLDGEIREGVGLLGSPCFEIPRSVERDSRFDHLRTGDELRRNLAAKNRYNLRTMALMLLVRWVHTFVVTALGFAAFGLYGALGHTAFAADLVLTFAFTVVYYVLVERCIRSFRPLRPVLCSIYDPRFWLHERLWKMPLAWLNLLNGTPFKTMVWRMLGARIGRQVFDDGCGVTERTLTAIGDGCALNAGAELQCHSQEDGTFKSDRTTLGAGCTVGVGAHVHYGVTIGDGAVLAPNSFLMKGEEVPPHARWGGNPAAEMADAPEDRSGGTGSATTAGTFGHGAAATIS